MEKAGGRVSQRRDDHRDPIQMAGAKTQTDKEGGEAKVEAGTETKEKAAILLEEREA